MKIVKQIYIAAFILNIVSAILFTLIGDPLWVVLSGVLAYINYHSYKKSEE